MQVLGDKPGTINALAQLLCPIILVEEVMRDLLQIRQMAMQQRTPDRQKVRVSWVIDLDNTPGILPGSNLPTVLKLNHVLRTDDRKRHQTTQLSVLLNGILIVLFDVVGEVVDGDAVVLDIFHDQLLALGELSGSQTVCLADDGDDVDARGEAAH